MQCRFMYNVTNPRLAQLSSFGCRCRVLVGIERFLTSANRAGRGPRSFLSPEPVARSVRIGIRRSKERESVSVWEDEGEQGECRYKALMSTTGDQLPISIRLSCMHDVGGGLLCRSEGGPACSVLRGVNRAEEQKGRIIEAFPSPPLQLSTGA